MLDPVTMMNLAQIRQEEMLRNERRQNASTTRQLRESNVFNMSALLSRIGAMLVSTGQKMKTQQRPIVKKAA